MYVDLNFSINMHRYQFVILQGLWFLTKICLYTVSPRRRKEPDRGTTWKRKPKYSNVSKLVLVVIKVLFYVEYLKI